MSVCLYTVQCVVYDIFLRLPSSNPHSPYAHLPRPFRSHKLHVHFLAASPACRISLDVLYERNLKKLETLIYRSFHDFGYFLQAFAEIEP
jgi:hypothetical protein